MEKDIVIHFWPKLNKIEHFGKVYLLESLVHNSVYYVLFYLVVFFTCFRPSGYDLS